MTNRTILRLRPMPSDGGRWRHFDRAGMVTLATSGRALAAARWGLRTRSTASSAPAFSTSARARQTPLRLQERKWRICRLRTEIAQAIFTSVNRNLVGRSSSTIFPSPARHAFRCCRTAPRHGSRCDGDNAGACEGGRFHHRALPDVDGNTDAADSGIHSFPDLAGKRIGVPRGGLEEAMYRAINAADG